MQRDIDLQRAEYVKEMAGLVLWSWRCIYYLSRRARDADTFRAGGRAAFGPDVFAEQCIRVERAAVMGRPL